jgi:hypothetical protein
MGWHLPAKRRVNGLPKGGKDALRGLPFHHDLPVVNPFPAEVQHINLETGSIYAKLKSALNKVPPDHQVIPQLLYLLYNPPHLLPVMSLSS